MKTIILPLFLTIFSISTYAQDFQTQFQDACANQDTTEQLKVLSKWEKTVPNDPELYTSFFNYYFQKSKQELIMLEQGESEQASFTLEAPSGEVVGFLDSRIIYQIDTLENGLAYLTKGIEQYPDRLDMRFGKTYAYQETKNWENFTQTLLEAIEYSSTNNNQWLWMNNEAVEDTKDFFLGNLQNYILNIYHTNDDALLPYMRRISLKVLEYYPEHIESLSNVAITYLLTAQYKKALAYLLQAEQFAPEDTIVIANIAHTYRVLDNTFKSIEYYQKLAKLGNEQTAAFAYQQLEGLQKD